MTDAIRTLIDDPRYAHAARAAAQALASLPGAPAAADIIEAGPA